MAGTDTVLGCTHRGREVGTRVEHYRWEFAAWGRGRCIENGGWDVFAGLAGMGIRG